MKSKKFYKVESIEIIKDGDVLEFNGFNRAQSPEHVAIAIMAVARYLKWLEETTSDKAEVTRSKTGRTVYVDREPVMHICKTGNSDWCRLTRHQILSALNSWEGGDYTLFPDYVFNVIKMFWVEKSAESYVEFDSADYERADRSFMEFMESHCKVAGHYSFRNEEFREETGLPTTGLVWHYLTNRHEFTAFNGLEISSACQTEDTIEITLC